MDTVFAITCNQHRNSLQEAKFYSTKEKARKALKEIAKDRRGRLGVEVHDDTKDLFTFLIGWEEHLVSFAVIELTVD